jgi:Protein of unknown function (DUF4089)
MKSIPDTLQFVEQMAELMGLSLSPEYQPGVVENFTRLAEIAAFVMDFPLPEDIEISPVFQP